MGGGGGRGDGFLGAGGDVAASLPLASFSPYLAPR